MKVARNDPAMPRATVSTNPVGLFGPGDRKRAMTPATKPIATIQMMADTGFSLRSCKDWRANDQPPLMFPNARCEGDQSGSTTDVASGPEAEYNTAMLQTARLRLQPWQEHHRVAFAALHADPVVMADLGGPISRAASDR